jgi:hypothetical protein
MGNTKHTDPPPAGPSRRKNSGCEVGVWVNYSNHPSGAQLPRIRLLDLPRLVRKEASFQARAFVMNFVSEGDLPDGGTDPITWMEVIGTLVCAPQELETPDGFRLELGRWDAALRYLRVGMHSHSREGFEGWRKKLSRDPRYALRASFLKHMKLGTGIRGQYRWELAPYWEPQCEEYTEAWKAWLRGDAPEPHPVDVVNVGKGSPDVE